MPQQITNVPIQNTGRTVRGYCARLRSNPSTPRLLVEGRYDRIFFEKLIDHLVRIQQFPHNQQLLATIRQHLDCAENIETTGGNRERVEEVCKFVDIQRSKIAFVGFVDREYRGFDVPHTFIDQLGCHHQVGSSVWTRGHSLENYFFNITILTTVYEDYALKAKTDARIMPKVLPLFIRFFDKSLYHALCIAMVAYELKIANKQIPPTITSDCFNVSNDVFLFEKEKWLPKIAGKTGLPHESIQTSLIKWQQRLRDISISCYEQICHGHITERILFNVFLCLVDDVVSEQLTLTKQEKKKLKNTRKRIEQKGGDDDNRFIDYSNKWIAGQLWDVQDSPLICLNKLGLRRYDGQ